MTWKDQAAGIWYSSYDGNSNKWSTETMAPGHGVTFATADLPSLATFNNKLYMTWRDSLTCNSGPITICVPAHIYYSSFDGQNWQTGMGNLPTISEHWNAYTHGNNAAVTKLVVTQDWQGNPLEFDVWPPARPDASSKMHWQHDEVYHPINPADHQPYINVTITEFPDHLHVKITPNIALDAFYFDTDVPDGVHLDCNCISREVVYSFMLWWEAPYSYSSQFGSLGYW